MGTDVMICEYCGGTGEIEVEYYRPQSFNRDVGFIEVEIECCDVCEGTGEVEGDEDGEE
jgi:RecJ-like exonuclease